VDLQRESRLNQNTKVKEVAVGERELRHDRRNLEQAPRKTAA